MVSDVGHAVEPWTDIYHVISDNAVKQWSGPVVSWPRRLTYMLWPYVVVNWNLVLWPEPLARGWGLLLWSGVNMLWRYSRFLMSHGVGSNYGLPRWPSATSGKYGCGVCTTCVLKLSSGTLSLWVVIIVKRCGIRFYSVTKHSELMLSVLGQSCYLLLWLLILKRGFDLLKW